MFFSITGTTEKSHKELANIIRSYGHHCGDFVNKDTDYLIANYSSLTKKYCMAIENNVKIISEKELFDFLKNL